MINIVINVVYEVIINIFNFRMLLILFVVIVFVIMVSIL